MSTQMEQSSQAVVGPPERRARALDPERVKFETWCKRWDGDSMSLKMNESGEYDNGYVQFAWRAWQEARPKRPAVGAAMNVVSMLAQRKPLTAFAELEAARQVGRRQLAKAYNRADEDTRLLAVKLIDALRAL
jgi:hypothetical protein